MTLERSNLEPFFKYLFILSNYRANKDPKQLVINGDDRNVCGFKLNGDKSEWIAQFSIFECSIDPIINNETIDFPINIQRNLFISHSRSHFDVDLICKFRRILHVSTGRVILFYSKYY